MMQHAVLRPGFIANMLPGEFIVAGERLFPAALPAPVPTIAAGSINRRIGRLLLGHDHDVFAFVGGAFPGGKGIGVLNADGLLVGGLVLHDWHPDEGVVRLAARAIVGTWLTRRLMRAVAAAVFDHLACQSCFMVADEANDAAISIARRLGCEEVRIPRLLGRDRAGIVLMLTEEAWRTSRFASPCNHRSNGKT